MFFDFSNKGLKMNIAIDSHKITYHPEQLQDVINGKVIAPIYVEVSPSSYCNHACIFCGDDYRRIGSTLLGAEILLQALVGLNRNGTKAVCFAGDGEPLKHPELLKIIGTAAGFLECSMSTNGELGSCEFWEKAIWYLDWVRFSVDAGTPDTFLQIHRSNEFETVVQNIKWAVWAKRMGRSAQIPKLPKGYGVYAVQGIYPSCDIEVQFVYLPENKYDLPIFLELFLDIGVDYLIIKPYSYAPNSLHQKKILYSKTDIDFISATVATFNSEKILFRKGSFLSANDPPRIGHCYALPFWGYITAQGDFYACSTFIGNDKFLCGNIHKDSIDDILYGERRRNVIKYAKTELNCMSLCRSNCRMARINEHIAVMINQEKGLGFI